MSFDLRNAPASYISNPFMNTSMTFPSYIRMMSYYIPTASARNTSRVLEMFFNASTNINFLWKLEKCKLHVQIHTDHKNLGVFMTTKILANYDFVLTNIKDIKKPADGTSRRPDYMKNYRRTDHMFCIAHGSTPIFKQSNHTLFISETRDSSFEVYWSDIGVHANTTPGASGSHFISSLKKDLLATEYNNPLKPWSWQDVLLLHDNLV